MLSISDFDAFCFDLDGTIYVENEVLPGVVETIHRLRQLGKKILFISNTPTQTRTSTAQKLVSFNIPVKEKDILTGAYITACYLKEHLPKSRCYLVGEPALEEEILSVGIQVTRNPNEATHVVIGLDRNFTYDKLNGALSAVLKGAEIIVTNPDPACPVPGGVIADTMSIAKAIETASGQRISKIIGKPSAYYASKVFQALDTTASRCLIIGDRLETDILLGIHASAATCIVLTGVTTEQKIELSVYKPKYVIHELTELLGYMES